MAHRWLGIFLVVLGLLVEYHGWAFGQTRPTDFSGDLFSVPEPGTLTLLSSGLAALAGIAWFRRRK
jgi:hypothetical protein